MAMNTNNFHVHNQKGQDLDFALYNSTSMLFHCSLAFSYPVTQTCLLKIDLGSGINWLEKGACFF